MPNALFPGYDPNLWSFALGPKRPNMPSPEVLSTIQSAVQAVDPSLTIRVVSGGGEYGSKRHRKAEGYRAADIQVLRNGNPLTKRSEPETWRELYRSFASSGVKGLGFYGKSNPMIHVDLVKQNAWGPDKHGASLPKDLRQAIDSGRGQGPVQAPDEAAKAQQVQIEPIGQPNPLDDSLKAMMQNNAAAKNWFRSLKQPPTIEAISPAFRPLLEAKAKELGTDAATVLRRGWELEQPPAPALPRSKPPVVTVESLGGTGAPTKELPVSPEAPSVLVPRAAAMPALGEEVLPAEVLPGSQMASALPGAAPAPLPTPLATAPLQAAVPPAPAPVAAPLSAPSTREQLAPEVQSILDSLGIVGGGEPPEIDEILQSLEAPVLPQAELPPREFIASPELQAYEAKNGAMWGGLAEGTNALLLGTPYAATQKWGNPEQAKMMKEAREVYQTTSPATAMLTQVGGEIAGLGKLLQAGKKAVAPVWKGLDALASRLGARSLVTTPGQLSLGAQTAAQAAKLAKGTLGLGAYGEILPGASNKLLRGFSGLSTGAAKGALMGTGLDLTNDLTLAENILLGALVSAPLEVAANALGRVLTQYWQSKASPGVKELVNEASGLGIPNEALPPYSRLVQGVAPHQPMEVFQKSLENATKTVLRTMGSRAKSATTSVLKGIEQKIQDTYNTVLPQIRVKADIPMNDFMVDMRTRLRKLPTGDYKNRLLHAWTTLQESMTETVVDAAGNVVRNPIWIDGTLWQKLVNKNGPLGAIINDNAAGEFKLYAREMRDALKDLVTRSTVNSNNGAQLLEKFDDANRKWKILQAVEKTMEKNPSGVISMPEYLDQMVGHYGKLGAKTQEEVLAKLGGLYPQTLPNGTPAITEDRVARYIRAIFGYGALPVAAAGGATGGMLLDILGLAARSGVPGSSYTNPLLFGGLAAAGIAGAAARNRAMQKDLTSPEALNYLLGRWRAPGQSPFVKSVVGVGEKAAAGTLAVGTYTPERKR